MQAFADTSASPKQHPSCKARSWSLHTGAASHPPPAIPAPPAAAAHLQLQRDAAHGAALDALHQVLQQGTTGGQGVRHVRASDASASAMRRDADACCGVPQLCCTPWRVVCSARRTSRVAGAPRSRLLCVLPLQTASRAPAATCCAACQRPSGATGRLLPVQPARCDNASFDRRAASACADACRTDACQAWPLHMLLLHAPLPAGLLLLLLQRAAAAAR